MNFSQTKGREVNKLCCQLVLIFFFLFYLIHPNQDQRVTSFVASTLLLCYCWIYIYITQLLIPCLQLQTPLPSLKMHTDVNTSCPHITNPPNPPRRKIKSQLDKSPWRRSDSPTLRISSVWLGRDPEEDGDGAPDVEVPRFRRGLRDEWASEWQREWWTQCVSGCWGMRSACEPPVSTQELYPDGHSCKSLPLLSPPKPDAPLTTPRSWEASQCEVFFPTARQH